MAQDKVSIDIMSASAPLAPELQDFLKPISIDVTKAHVLAHELHQTYRYLAAESLTQFLPTPISESILRPTGGRERGRYVYFVSFRSILRVEPQIAD